MNGQGCEHLERWGDGVRSYCSDCGHEVLIDPEYGDEEDEAGAP